VYLRAEYGEDGLVEALQLLLNFGWVEVQMAAAQENMRTDMTGLDWGAVAFGGAQGCG
jgi:hypothetical protein